MPVFVAALLGGLVNIVGTLAGRVLVGLGISVLTYSGLSTTFGWLQTQAVTSLTGLPVSIVGMMALLKVGTCISMVASAITVKMTLDGLTGGTVKKWVKT